MQLRLSTWVILAAVGTFGGYKAFEHYQPERAASLFQRPVQEVQPVQELKIGPGPGPLVQLQSQERPVQLPAQEVQQPVQVQQLVQQPVQEVQQPVQSKMHDRGLDAVFGKK